MIEEVLNTAGIGVADLDKIHINQANEKMDEAIVKQVFNTQGIQGPPKQLVPMTISWLGNSSVATLPPLFDLIAKGNMEGHETTRSRHILFAAMGTGAI